MSVTVKQMTITQMSRVILSDLQGSDDVVPSEMLLILGTSDLIEFNF